MKHIRSIVLWGVAISMVTNLYATEKKFQTDSKTGLQYRFIKHNKKGTPFAGSEFAHVVIHWTGPSKGGTDSVYLDTHKTGGDSAGGIIIPVKSAFKGCLEDGIKMMMQGDSAEFKINADSLYIKAFHVNAQRIPSFITASTFFIFDIKLLNFANKDDMMAARQAEMKRLMAKRDARRGQEGKDITAYLQQNHLDVKPNADSIFFLQVTKGTGPQVQEGDSLDIKYTGMFLDGTVFDKSDRGMPPGTLKVFYTKNANLIQGWIKVLGEMNEGEKVRVLIPSLMAYGVRGSSSTIQPYTPLIFDIEVVRLKPNN